MAVQTSQDSGNVAFILSGDAVMREAETIAQDAARVAALAPKTVMARNASTRKWVPLTDVDPTGAPAYLTCGALGTTVAAFQAITDGEFAFTVDGVLINVTGLDFSDIDAASDTPAYLTCGALGTTVAAFQAITDGEFAFTVDGAAIDVTGLDFSDVDAETDTPAYLTCGANGTNIAGYAAVANAQFGIAVGGTSHNITCDFNTTAVTTWAEVAMVINAELMPFGARCEYDYAADVFLFFTDELGRDAAIGYLTAGAGGTDISGAGYLNGLTGTGVITAGTGGIGASITSVINEKAVGRFNCEWDAAANALIFNAREAGRDSAITVLSAVAGGAGTDISGAGYLNGLVGTGVVTAGTGGIGASITSVIDAEARGRFNVEWDAAADALIFNSPTSGGQSSITVLSAVAGGAGTDISGAGYLNGAAGVVTAATGFTGQNIPMGVYIGASITAASLVAGDVTNCPILVGKDITVDEDQLVLENSLTLNTVVVAKQKTIEDVLTEIGIYPEKVVDIAGYENA